MRAAETGLVFEGALGNTTRRVLQVTGSDGRAFPAPVYTCVNVSDDPELVDQIQPGEPYLVEDPVSSELFGLALALRVHDPERGIFALVVPDALRHREYALRAELLEELSASPDPLPEYVRRFDVVFGPDGLERLIDEADKPRGAQTTSVPKISEERAELHEERTQLDEVRERIDRERAQLDQQRGELQALREGLEQREQRLEAMKLNLEQARLRAAQGESPSTREEATQVVTDDQFIEVFEEPPSSEEEATQITESPLGSADVASQDIFDDALAADLDGYIEQTSDEVCLRLRVDEARADQLSDASLEFFIQLHDIDGRPVVGLTLAALDDDAQCVASAGYPLDPESTEHGALLARLTRGARIRVLVFSGRGVRLRHAHDSGLEENVAWIVRRAQKMLTSSTPLISFDEAAAKFMSEEFARVGQMRHNFERDRFSVLDTPAQIKLASGIVGYWSSEEMYAYLVANRSFSISDFRVIRERVVESAVAHGIYINSPLREDALSMSLADDSADLVERLMANFAEVSVRLKTNDLDPYDEWENWDALITFAEEVGLEPDPEVLELAERSLKRAQEFHDS